MEKSNQRRVTRDLLSGRMTVDFPRWTFRKEMTDIGAVSSSTAQARYEIVDGDPLSASMSTQYDVEIQRPDTTIFHRSVGRLSCTANHFIVETTVSVGENGQEIFRRSWNERIARDMV